MGNDVREVAVVACDNEVVRVPHKVGAGGYGRLRASRWRRPQQ